LLVHINRRSGYPSPTDGSVNGFDDGLYQATSPHKRSPMAPS
jgi:hypothetical protein